MPATILILGATGGTGSALVDLLLRYSDARLVLAGRGAEALARAAAHAAGAETPRAGAGAPSMRPALPVPGAAGRISTRVIDGRAPAAELRASFEGTELVVIAAPLTVHVPGIVSAAAAAGADTLDIQYSPAKVAGLRAMEGELVLAGRTAITDGGFHPGLPGVLVRALEDRFDVVRSARVAGVMQEDWRSLQLRRETAWEFVEMLADIRPAHFLDGRWIEEKATSSAALARIDFGPPFGTRQCYAMPLAEVRAWAEGRPGLRRAGFYVGGFNPVVDHLLLPLAMLARRVAPVRSSGPMAALLMAALRTFGHPPFGTLVRAEMAGEANGAERREVLTVSHPSSYALTAMPVAATVLQWEDGAINGPGVRLQALAVEPRRFLEDLRRLGATVTGLATSPAEAPAGLSPA